MLDTVYIGMSGLTGYAKGLRVIGNNLVNVNTPGFKSSQLQFADLFYQGGASKGQSYSDSGSGSGMQLGTGLKTLSTSINFKAGEPRQTGNDLDMAINGEGLFVTRDGDQTQYTRAGQFQFDKDGFLVSQNNGHRMAGLDASGKVTDISLNGLRSNPPKATQEVRFTGNLSSNAATDITINSVPVIDAAGGQHNVTLVFKNDNATAPGRWTVTISDAAGTIGSGTIEFANGLPVAGSSTVTATYSPPGAAPLALRMNFSENVTTYADGNTSTIGVSSQDGRTAGSLTKVAFDEDGTLIATYSNGQTAKGARLALARFDSPQDVMQLGGNEFVSKDPRSVHLGYAKSQVFGSISSGVIEGSNVDMAEEFSNLIVMQRGYQASSHVISTANDMIQELFDMKGHR